jgi:phosphoglycerate dehydrogenase-like enzyme
MPILYHGGSNQEFADDLQAQAVDLDTLLRESDFISIHAPLNDKTRRMIGARELSLMKPTAVLVNTARGGVIDTAALVDALQRNVIACAALDVTDPEPIPPDHPLMQLPNCVIAPHLGSSTWRTRELMGMLAVENLLAGLRGERLPHCVNPKLYATY